MTGESIRGVLVVCAACVAVACSLKAPSRDLMEGVGGTGGGTQVPGGGSASDGSGGTEGPLAAAGADGQAGGCEGAQPAVGTPCGQCGAVVCNPDYTTSCFEPPHNACGGCGVLELAPGDACGTCGKYACASDNESVTCVDPGLNACGGCGVLASAPGSSCGDCGDWQCTEDKSDVRCSGVNTNACGGCGTLAQPPGGSCGACGTYECTADKSQTTCNDLGTNACGGCAVLSGIVGASCGTCAVYGCAADKNALVCSALCSSGQVCLSGQCWTPDCSAPNSCGRADGAGGVCRDTAGRCVALPNTTVSCVGSSCAYVCKGPTLSCSSSSRPACGSWDFESNQVEGWSVSNRSDGANVGDVYLAAPPGGGAGAYSLALNVDSASDAQKAAAIYVSLCNDLNATGLQGSFYASVWFEPSDGLGGTEGPAFAHPSNFEGSTVGGRDSVVPANQWFDVSTQPIGGEPEVGMSVVVLGLENRRGVLYFDNMRFE